MLASYTSASSAGGDDDYAFELGGYGSKKKGSTKKGGSSKHQKKSKLSFNVDSDDGYAGSAAASPIRAPFSPATVASEESTGRQQQAGHCSEQTAASAGEEVS
jgi:hypothetical protein